MVEDPCQGGGQEREVEKCINNQMSAPRQQTGGGPDGCRIWFLSLCRSDGSDVGRTTQSAERKQNVKQVPALRQI